MERFDSGSYVRYEDYESLEKERDELRKLCAEAAEWCYRHKAGDDWKDLYRRLMAEVRAEVRFAAGRGEGE